MKNVKYLIIIMLSSLIAFNTKGVDSVPTLDYLASKAMNPRAFAQQILDGTIDKVMLHELENSYTFETLAELVAKELYLLDFSSKIDYVPSLVEKHFKGVSIQDLLNNDLLPEITVEGNIKILNLQGERINSLEGYKKIPGIQQVHQIDLSNNLIKQLPRDFALENLMSLNLSSNKLQTLPTQLHLPQLKYLDVSWNQLEAYPNPTTLPSIKQLILRNNDFKTIPAMSYPVLENFNVANNKIEAIAEGFYLPRVREFNVKNNKLSDIPSIGAEHPVIINWEGNQFSPETKEKIGQRFPQGSIFIPGL